MSKLSLRISPAAQQTILCTALMAAIGGGLFASTSTAFAQDQVQRVEITGSSIKRVDAETSEPVTIVKMDDLKKQGVTTVEQILQSVSAVQMSVGTSQVVGTSSGGAAFADVRGIGANKTLVLLNGRRIANNAFDSSAPDLNMIPFGAIERVEVLRDGASSLYGTDAIGGVINFITRKDYKGGQIALGLDAPQHPGGAGHSANIGFGAGDLQKDGLNVFGFVDFSKTAPIGGNQRPLNARLPGGLSPTTSPANYQQAGANGYGNPDAAAGCTAPGLTPDPSSKSDCNEATAEFVNYTPAAERVSGLLRGALKLGNDHTLTLEAFGSHNRTDSVVAPVPYGLLYQNRLRPDGSPNPYFPGNGNFTPTIPLDPNFQPNATQAAAGALPGFLVVKWRDLANGSREDISDNTQTRVSLGLEGSLFGWDYDTALTLNNNRVVENLAGYSNGDIISQGVLDGVINPFGAQDAAGTALINSAADAGTLQSAQGTVQQIDGHASHDLVDWFHSGRPAAVAVGLEARHERFSQAANAPFAAEVQASTGVDPNTHNSGQRDIYAGFVELDVPVLHSLDVTLAGRYDDYSDFGDTFNPKASFRFEPSKRVLLRGSWSTGFRAPSLYELNAAPAYTDSPEEDDPVNCPGGVDIHHQGNVCGQQFQVLQSGNLHLRPEKSQNATLGLVLEPIDNLALEFDGWSITYKNHIGALAAQTVFDDPTTFAKYYHRNAEGLLSTDGSACPGTDCGYVDLTTQNQGRVITNGLDIISSYRASFGGAGNLNLGLQSTWVHKYAYQDIAGGVFHQNVGVFTNGQPVFRWQHNAEASWNLAPFTLGVAGHYKSGYLDQTPQTPMYGADGTTVIGQHTNRVSDYATFDVYGSYAAAKGYSLTVGIRNLADRQPPFSNQTTVFQANYDPRFADPTGRTYYVRGIYSF